MRTKEAIGLAMLQTVLTENEIEKYTVGDYVIIPRDEIRKIINDLSVSVFEYGRQVKE